MLRIGVMAPSEIAFRRFVPAIKKSTQFEYAGVACALECEWDTDCVSEAVKHDESEKAKKFQEKFGGRIFQGYRSMICSDDIDAIYVPLPPGIHFYWGELVIKSGKNLLLEKPFTDSLFHTKQLISLAHEKKLAVHENFAFVYHKQLNKLSEIIDSGKIGELRLIRAAFGFPYRGEGDFRYHSSLGGGALLDCGGYPTRLAALLLGNNTRVTAASLCSAREHDVDVFGSATLQNDDGLTAQISFGMDNSYKCELEVWGSKGCIKTNRIFTPTAEMQTALQVTSKETIEISVDPDDQFLNSLDYFAECIKDKKRRENRYFEILRQAELMNEIRCLGNE